MNAFEKLTEENQAKVRSYDDRFIAQHPHLGKYEDVLRRIECLSDLRVVDLLLLESILGYDTMNETYSKAFKK
jgi:hypothetical protein